MSILRFFVKIVDISKDEKYCIKPKPEYKNKDVTVRKMRPDDSKRVVELLSFGFYDKFIFCVGKENMDISSKLFEETLKSSEAARNNILVAEVDNKVQGICQLKFKCEQ